MSSAPHSLGLVRFGDRTATPWKNGQGSTREIARRLLGGKGPHFVWRLSVADITHDADFSSFPGVERSAMLISGGGLVLEVAGSPHELRPFEPFSFDGGAETHARLTSGPASILNVMTVSNRMSASVRVADLSNGRPLSIAGATVLVQLTGQSTVYAADGASAHLRPLDALVPRPRVRLVAGSGTAAVVRMENFRAWRAFSW
ncbi:MAG: HutD family protein [Actinomycetota bacterium]|nr:HutD family protein [Actinomycetota bacterium]